MITLLEKIIDRFEIFQCIVTVKFLQCTGHLGTSNYGINWFNYFKA